MKKLIPLISLVVTFNVAAAEPLYTVICESLSGKSMVKEFYNDYSTSKVEGRATNRHSHERKSRNTFERKVLGMTLIEVIKNDGMYSSVNDKPLERDPSCRLVK